VKPWSPSLRTSIGVFVEVAEGGRFSGAGGNRYSFIYSGDVNGDGQGGNDLIYIPLDQSEIQFDTCANDCGSNVTPDQQWAALDAFIKQDKYLSAHRGEISERFGEVNPWYSNIDLRILQDFAFGGAQEHNFQVSVDLLNVANLISSDWGVRKIASSSPLSRSRFKAASSAWPRSLCSVLTVMKTSVVLNCASITAPSPTKPPNRR